MDPVIGLSLGRIVLGGVSVARPDLGAQLFRLDADNNRQLPYMTRMFGSREIAIGLLTLLSRGQARRRLVLAGIALDGADTYAGVVAGKDGSVSKQTSALLTAPAALAVVTGVASLRPSRKGVRAGT